MQLAAAGLDWSDLGGQDGQQPATAVSRGTGVQPQGGVRAEGVGRGDWRYIAGVGTGGVANIPLVCCRRTPPPPAIPAFLPSLVG